MKRMPHKTVPSATVPSAPDLLARAKRVYVAETANFGFVKQPGLTSAVEELGGTRYIVLRSNTNELLRVYVLKA